MKILFLIIFLFNASNLASQSKNWKIVDSVINVPREYYGELKCSDSINCMSWIYLDPEIGYLFRRTTDGGLTWKTSYTNMESNLSDIAYPDTNLFIGVGSSGVIVKSTDKGLTWARMIYDTNSRLSKIRMLNSNFGIIVGYKLYKDSFYDSLIVLQDKSTPFTV